MSVSGACCQTAARQRTELGPPPGLLVVCPPRGSRGHGRHAPALGRSWEAAPLRARCGVGKEGAEQAGTTARCTPHLTA